VDPGAIYTLTAKGSGELNSARTSLSSSELSILVLLDGKATVAQVRASAGAMSAEAVDQALQNLAKSGFIASVLDITSDHIDAGNFFRPSASEADAGVASLKQAGYFVKFTRKAASERTLAKDEKITVLVVEDDEQLAKLLRMYLKMEGYEVRVAANRAEINAALRQEPRPNVILLDVVLPDIDGFDVLARIKGHPSVRDIPVIMTTGKATREAVLAGLSRGADGYVTKPFNVDNVLTAVKSVLGLK
jgi:two-component system OmpR family response regulator